ncbi:hypothetical protein K438DRAFT_1764730 [Mycena galopus ATCC 62051]|nr:hypothetical protein K438DRAFT_1764730 [Mycena galopus ATCC 62051]
MAHRNIVGVVQLYELSETEGECKMRGMTNHFGAWAEPSVRVKRAIVADFQAGRDNINMYEGKKRTRGPKAGVKKRNVRRRFMAARMRTHLQRIRRRVLGFARIPGGRRHLKVLGIGERASESVPRTDRNPLQTQGLVILLRRVARRAVERWSLMIHADDARDAKDGQEADAEKTVSGSPSYNIQGRTRQEPDPHTARPTRISSSLYTQAVAPSKLRRPRWGLAEDELLDGLGLKLRSRRGNRLESCDTPEAESQLPAAALAANAIRIDQYLLQWAL